MSFSVEQDQVLHIQSFIPACFSLWKYVLSQIHDRYISVMTAFGKEIGYSLVAFCLVIRSSRMIRFRVAALMN